jgi:hypothetical protein
MVFTHYAVFLLGASALSVTAQLTPAPPAPSAAAPPASTGQPNAEGLPLTALSYTYPNLVRTHVNSFWTCWLKHS